ncbi:M15 family metallopeptidase [Lacicoccus alkaliphilus]|uniref:D-alanyl-D-alanine carboxypeptidase n=1 Tax=Lacicoccus alkaliphilus DSM 16010 TaxID=1123231 RepID=A0A1M7J9D2_9BACL|nr:M15 family metallopeptidase [Salinicoccus alkaliphilus]SHM49521.1 D-alanyl-D-alanine carboxypeptidase [Salinicoccus alkaliphilus DSM 16010]
MKPTPRLFLIMVLGVVLTGCTEAAAEPSDQPAGTFEKTVEEYDVGSFAVPVFREVDGVTYINDILIVNREYDLPPDYNPGLEPEVIDATGQLMEDAAAEGFSLVIVSGFRSYQDQEAVHEDFVDRLGPEEAEQYTLPPGHSEHQSGLAVDIGTVESASSAAVSFGETEAYAWMKDVAHEYGFVIRYQEGKEDITGLSYEPWHLRYVGVEPATEMYEEDLVLEEYLGID